MSREDDFKKYATEYDPIKVGSIDGKVRFIIFIPFIYFSIHVLR